MKALIAIVLAGSPSVTFAIQGCLRDEVDLARRASVIVVVTIDKIAKTSVEACPEPTPLPAEVTSGGETFIYNGYSECGEVGMLKGTVDQVIRGDVSRSIDVLVGNEVGLRLTCDDRPELPEMADRQAILYLRRDGERWWTLDGPDSIYSSSPQRIRLRQSIPQR